MIAPTLLYRGTVGNSAATVATTSTAGVSTINSVVATNKTSSAHTFSITVGGIYIAYAMPIAAYQTITLDIRQVANPGTVIQAWADAASSVDISISAAVQTPSLFLGSGTGSPEGVLTANQGATWVQTNDASLGNMIWRKLSGTGNTGWYPDFEGRWKTYTPTLTAVTTNPTNWTQTGYYTQYGKAVVAKILLSAGASMTAGSGIYRVNLPVNANANYFAEVGSIALYDSSATNQVHSAAVIQTATYFQMQYQATHIGVLTLAQNTTPWTWAANDTIRGTITYEAA